MSLGNVSVLRTCIKVKRCVEVCVNRIINWNQISRNDFKIYFANDISIGLNLPPVSLVDAIFDCSKKMSRLMDFYARPSREVLLRQIVKQLYNMQYIDQTKSIIDVGCWLADNAVPWSLRIQAPAKVYAIDPSEENLAFGRAIAEKNNIENICWVNAVCSDAEGEPLSFVGDLSHATFVEASSNESCRMSTTLDGIIGSEHHSDIGLMHVDVEGFEQKVIAGATSIIEASRPVIIFEQHISQDNVDLIKNFLESRDYSVYMINEVLPGCALDCRNFIALDRGRTIPDVDSISRDQGRKSGIFFATPQADLIHI